MSRPTAAAPAEQQQEPEQQQERGSHMQLRVLGPVSVLDAQGLTSAQIPGPRAKSLLIALALADGKPVPATSLIESVWGLDAPESAKAALQTLISRTRAAAAGMVISENSGYRLGVATDLARASQTLSSAKEQLSAAPAAALTCCTEALGWWTAEPGAGAATCPALDELTVASESLLTSLRIVGAQAALAASQAAVAVDLLDGVVNAEPLNEPLQLAYCTALAGTGRTPEALAHLDAYRRRLRENLGASLGPEAAALQQRLLDPPTQPATQPTNQPAAAEPSDGAATAPRNPSPTVAANARHESAALFRSGLRTPPNPLLGRTEQVEQLEELLREHRLVTILGPGGLGKTRLGVELVNRAAAAGHPAVVMVELASVRDGADLWLALAGGLGITSPRQKPTVIPVQIREQVIAKLAAARTLLFLDNCEHVVDAAAAVVAELIAAIESLHVLLTSRSPLDIGGEHVFGLQPLDSGTGSAAVQLFMDRATAARPDVQLPTEAVQDLCERLDGLPLAIELAAAKVRVMSVAEILDRITDRLALSVLRGTDRTAPQRHRTLRAVIDWSWTLLTQGQKRTLRRLCTFPAGFTLPAAAVVASDEFGLTPSLAAQIQVEDDLEALVNQSLLRVVDDERAGASRYRMLETVREFCAEEQADAGESELVGERMFAWARQWCLVRGEKLFGPEQVRTLREVTAELDNLVFLLRLAISGRRTREVYAIFSVLAIYWSLRSLHQEVMNFAPAIVEAVAGEAIADEDIPPALAALVALSANIAFIDLRTSAKARTTIRRLLKREVEIPAAVRIMAQAWLSIGSMARVRATMTAAQHSEDTPVVGMAYMIEAMQFENEGHTHRAISAAQRAYSCSERSADVWTMGNVAMSLAQLYAQLSDHESALRWAGTAEKFITLIDSEADLRQLRGIIASNQLSLGKIQAAKDAVREDLGLPDSFEDTDFPGAEPVIRAEIALAEGHIAQGLAAYRRLMRQIRRVPMVGPYGPVFFAAGIAAFVLHGDVADPVTGAEVAGWVQRLRLRALALMRMSSTAFLDRPALGSAALAVGSWAALSAEPGSARALTGLRLQAMIGGRQDVPSLVRSRHWDRAVERLGAEQAELALAEAVPFNSEKGPEILVRYLSDPSLRD